MIPFFEERTRFPYQCPPPSDYICRKKGRIKQLQVMIMLVSGWGGSGRTFTYLIKSKNMKYFNFKGAKMKERKRKTSFFFWWRQVALEWGCASDPDSPCRLPQHGPWAPGAERVPSGPLSVSVFCHLCPSLCSVISIFCHLCVPSSLCIL